MASKYDSFWRERLPDLVDALGRAADGEQAELDVSAIKALGDRASWYGSARVRDRALLAGNMAHAVSLGRQVLQSGMLFAWPGTEFVLSVSDGGRLSVGASRPAGDTVPAQEFAAPRLDTHSSQSLEPGSVDPSDACRRIHQAMDALPAFKEPADVPFSDGLYFFFERGEENAHGSAERIVRIGNHPLSEHRLVGRLKDHYRTAPNGKNGSVFRRYLGGALIRRSSPSARCLEPGPGLGHWERQKVRECPICEPFEQVVSAHLSRQMFFRCVRVDDMELRNGLEKALIATVAQCGVCSASDGWLGHLAYPKEVRTTGLWNKQHTSGPSISHEELLEFESLASVAKAASGAMGQSGSPRSDALSDTLLVIPCSGGKSGASIPILPTVSVADLLPTASVELLKEGREQAFSRQNVQIDFESPQRPALATYSGQPFATGTFRSELMGAMEEGLHCLIISGGYGLLRPEEPIHTYKAHLPSQTRGVWAPRLRRLLPRYVAHNQIRRAFVAVSGSYASCLPVGFAPEEWWGVPLFDRDRDHGSAMRVVPAKVGGLVVKLLREGLDPKVGWRRSAFRTS